MKSAPSQRMFTRLSTRQIACLRFYLYVVSYSLCSPRLGSRQGHSTTNVLAHLDHLDPYNNEFSLTQHEPVPPGLLSPKLSRGHLNVTRLGCSLFAIVLPAELWEGNERSGDADVSRCFSLLVQASTSQGVSTLPTYRLLIFCILHVRAVMVCTVI